VASYDEKSELTRANVVTALLQNQMEENVFVRHYEETRFKITQMTITLSGLLIGALRFGNSQQHTARLLGIFIILLGILGALISAKYTERADRHANLSRAYRRAASNLLSQIDNSDLERYMTTPFLNTEMPRALLGCCTMSVRCCFGWGFISV